MRMGTARDGGRNYLADLRDPKPQKLVGEQLNLILKLYEYKPGEFALIFLLCRTMGKSL